MANSSTDVRRLGAGGGEEPMHVLLVDDNERWAQFMASELEDHDPDFRVTVALGANEAVLALQDSESIDCVVTDYQMPEIDGIQLVERVHEERPELPFLLVTSEGSEDVALRALEAGVTDYLRKNPRTDQTSLFANRIRRAVEQYRLQQAIRESEKRYRTVTEQSRDAIAIVRNDTVVFHNQRFLDLVGADSETFEGRGFTESVVHPDDRERVRETISTWQTSETDADPSEARLLTDSDEIRHCEYTGGPIRYRNDPAVLLSIRDVTRRKSRERERRWQRELTRNVQRELIASRTRTQLESTIVEQLFDSGYDLVWVGEVLDGELEPRAVRGADTYLRDLDLTTGGETQGSEPSLVAIRTGEPQFMPDVESLFPTDWRDAALDTGLGAGGALPLVYNDVLYGVLAVYDTDPDRFDESEQQLLEDIADSVSFAMHTLETETALASDHTVKATVQVRDTAYYLVDLVRQSGLNVSETTLTVTGTLPHESEQFIQYVNLPGTEIEAFREAATAHPVVQDVTVISDGDDGRVQLIVAESTPEARLASRGAVVLESTVTADHADIVVHFPAKQSLGDAVDALEDEYDSVSVLSTVETTRSDAGGFQSALETISLTEKQSNALRAAYHHGYFDRPRGSSASEIADSLGVAHSTFLQHLRTAQRKVFEQHYG